MGRGLGWRNVQSGMSDTGKELATTTGIPGLLKVMGDKTIIEEKQLKVVRELWY